MVVEEKAGARALASFQLLQQPLSFWRQRSAQGAASREVRLGFRELALHQLNEAAIPVGVGSTRFEPERLIIIGDGAHDISFGGPYVAAIGPGVSRLRF